MSEQLKNELAKDLGFYDTVQREGWGGIKAKDAGNMVKRAIQMAEQAAAKQFEQASTAQRKQQLSRCFIQPQQPAQTQFSSIDSSTAGTATDCLQNARLNLYQGKQQLQRFLLICSQQRSRNHLFNTGNSGRILIITRITKA